MYNRGLIFTLAEALYGELDQISEEAMTPTIAMFYRQGDSAQMSLVIQHDPESDVTEELRDQIVSVYCGE